MGGGGPDYYIVIDQKTILIIIKYQRLNIAILDKLDNFPVACCQTTHVHCAEPGNPWGFSPDDNMGCSHENGYGQ